MRGAGLLAAAYAAGYMVAVPVLASLTDRIDARRLLLGGSLFSAAATIAFGGADAPGGWLAGFAVLAAGGSLWPLALWWSRTGARMSG